MFDQSLVVFHWKWIDFYVYLFKRDKLFSLTVILWTTRHCCYDNEAS